MLANYQFVAFIATANGPGARAFYEGILGLKCLSDDPFALVFEGKGASLRITKVQEVVVAPYTVLGWEVPDVSVAVNELAAAGVRFERIPSLEQEANGVWSAPGGTKVAWFKDPDGHTLSLSSQ